MVATQRINENTSMTSPEKKDNAPVLILKDTFKQSEFLQTHIEITSAHISLEEQGALQIFPLDGLYDEMPSMQEEVRMHIAQKISALAPMLAENDKHYLLEYTIKILNVLAEDQTARVRRIVAEELKDSYHAPAEIIRKLAYDQIEEVAVPILEYSPLLSDSELVDILSTTKLPWVSKAIANRETVSEAVSDAIVMTKDESAIFDLLKNTGATLSEDGIYQIAGMAAEHEHWHIPLVSRHEITIGTVNRIAEFVSYSLFRQLEEENRMTPEMLAELKQSVQRRLQDPGWNRHRSAKILAEDLFYRGRLDAERIKQAINEQEHEFVHHALALLTDFSYEKVAKILSSNNARTITALAWQAGLSMRDGILLQTKIGQIQPAEVLYAKEGIEYPLSPEQMQEYLEFFSQ